MRIGLRYDLRCLEDAERAARYRAALDQSEFADEHGFDYVRLNEHHGAPDGYLPSPLVAAAAVGARTSRLKVRVTVLLLPLHDPIRVAEDAAVADLFSGGRLELVVGAGYVPREFELFGRELSDRVGLLEAGIGTLRAAWAGEPVGAHGVTVTPRPAGGRIPLYVGGSTKAAARRAARIGDGFEPSAEELGAEYERERARLGRTDCDPHARPTAVGVMRFMHVARDPEAAWEQIASHALHEMNSYGEWAQQSAKSAPAYRPVSDIAEVVASGIYRVVTPEECVAYARTLGADNTIELHPLMGGMPIELGWESLRLFVDEVLPVLRSRAPQGSEPEQA